MTKGFVYINQNPAMPGLLKVGVTEKIPTARANELFTTGVPEPFVVSYYCLVEDAKAVEREVHRRLNAQRHQGNREFFRIDLDQAIGVILQTCSPEHQWRIAPHEITAVSRHGLESEEQEMDAFIAAAVSYSLESNIRSLFYDSKSCTCSIVLKEGIDEFSPLAYQILDLAQGTISQFEWFGYIQHGRRVDTDEAEF